MAESIKKASAVAMCAESSARTLQIYYVKATDAVRPGAPFYNKSKTTPGKPVLSPLTPRIDGEEEIL